MISSDWDHMTNHFQKLAFSVNSTRPHKANTVSVFQSLFFQWIRPIHTKPILLCVQIFPLWRAFAKVYTVFIVFVWPGHKNKIKCLHFQMKTHPCGQGLSICWWFIFAVLSFYIFSIILTEKTNCIITDVRIYTEF